MAFNAEDFKDDAEFSKFITDRSTKAAQEAVTTAVQDLKSKNEEIIGEKKKLQAQLSKFGDMDIEAATKAMDFLSKNETAQLIADGKFDEVLATHTEKLKADYQDKIDALSTERDGAFADRDTHKSRYEVSIVDSEIRKLALKEGVLPDALEDVMARGRQVFSHGEDGSVEARNAKGELLKVDDKLVTTASWLKTLPRHYWPASAGVGAEGGKMTDKEARMASAAASGDHATYRKLRKAK
jgi:hypothetical protein